MCIIIDTDTLGRVFDPTNAEHRLFEPVLKWIIEGPGIIVYGGSTYEKQLRAAKRYIPIITEFGRKRKVYVVDLHAVDAKEREIRGRLSHRDFDDQHLVAILLVSGCLLVCTADKESHQFLRHPTFFPRRNARPKIYGRLRDKPLLCSRNIPARFKPCTALSGSERNGLTEAVKGAILRRHR